MMPPKKIINRIITNPLIRTFLIYVSGGWITLEITDYIINNYGLNSRVRDVLSIILLVGLPVVIFLAWYLGRDQEEREVRKTLANKENSRHRFLFRIWRKRWFFIPVLVVMLLLILTGIRSLHKHSKTRWALNKALPEMEACIHEFDFVGAFEISKRIKPYVSENPEFTYLDSFATIHLTILTQPSGADVYYKAYSDADGDWTLLGTTPIVRKAMPYYTLYRWKFLKPGYEEVLAADLTERDTLFRTLFEQGKVPEGMVYVEGIGDEPATSIIRGESDGFFIDKFEVSNKDYKAFVDKGGYQRPEFWQNEFELDKRILSFEEAMGYFRDATDQPGPALWVAGDYPDGQDAFPVRGISWYEADAYATYAGKDLPSISHWRSAAGHVNFHFRRNFASHQIPLSNMHGEGPEAIGINTGISPYGTFDMAGNVREWCWNLSSEEHTILGGAWNDVVYMTMNMTQLPSFDRSPKNGFRCAIYPDKDGIDSSIFEPVSRGTGRDYRLEEPVSEMEYQIYRKQFLYDKSDLNSRIEDRDESPDDWTVEEISFDAAYENERMIAYLFLPRNARPPYQTIIYFPGDYARWGKMSIFDDIFTNWNLDFLMKNGRAVLFPIYKGTYERDDGSCGIGTPSDSHQYRDCLIKWVKDFSRSVDYLESREDIDTSRLCYMGDSWGGYLGALIPAVEDRLKLTVIIRGGLGKFVYHLPEADEINYVSHIHTPTLMLNGKYDVVFPLETTVQPMMDLLGTQEEDKKLVLYDTDHYIPKTEMVKEVLNWLNLYFGSVPVGAP